jgi:hypothetical protein
MHLCVCAAMRVLPRRHMCATPLSCAQSQLQPTKPPCMPLPQARTLQPCLHQRATSCASQGARQAPLCPLFAMRLLHAPCPKITGCPTYNPASHAAAACTTATAAPHHPRPSAEQKTAAILCVTHSGQTAANRYTLLCWQVHPNCNTMLKSIRCLRVVQHSVRLPSVAAMHHSRNAQPGQGSSQLP